MFYYVFGLGYVAYQIPRHYCPPRSHFQKRSTNHRRVAQVFFIYLTWFLSIVLVTTHCRTSSSLLLRIHQRRVGHLRQRHFNTMVNELLRQHPPMARLLTRPKHIDLRILRAAADAPHALVVDFGAEPCYTQTHSAHQSASHLAHTHSRKPREGT